MRRDPRRARSRSRRRSTRPRSTATSSSSRALRPRPAPHFGTPGRREAMETDLRQNPSLGAYRPLYERALAIAGDAPSPYAAVVAARDVVPRRSELRLRPEPRRARRPAAARRVRHAHPSRLLPALRGGDGADAPLPRHPRACRRRVHERFVRPGAAALEGDRPRRAHLGRGVVPRATAGCRSTRLPAAAISTARTARPRSASTQPRCRPRSPQGSTRRTTSSIRSASTAGRRGPRCRTGRDLPGDVSGTTSDGSEGSLLRLLALAALALAAGIGSLKLALRRARFLTRDPRRVAAACRRELEDFLADQKIAVPESATPAELGEVVRQEVALDVAPFVDAVNAARYGPPDRAEEAARRARRELRRIERRFGAGSRAWERAPRARLGPLARPDLVVAHAIVMAAGEGRRLRPITERWPKPVLPIDGRPVLGTLLRELAAARCRAGVRRHRAPRRARSVRSQATAAPGDSTCASRTSPVRTARPTRSRRALEAGADAAVPRRRCRHASSAPETSAASSRPRRAARRSPSAGRRRPRRLTASRSQSRDGLVTTVLDDDPANPFAAAPLWLLTEEVVPHLRRDQPALRARERVPGRDRGGRSRFPRSRSGAHAI